MAKKKVTKVKKAKKESPVADETPNEVAVTPVVEIQEELTEEISSNGQETDSPEVTPQPEIEMETPVAQEEKHAEVPEPSADHVDNTSFLNQKIDKLISLKEENNFSDFWFYVKELNTMIFALRGVPKEDRHKFKERISELCDEAKKTQDELKEKIAKTSHIKLDRIRGMLDEVGALGHSPEELEKAFLKVEEANKFLREGIVKPEDGEESGDMSRGDREKAKEWVKQARDKIFDRKRETRDANFNEVKNRLGKIELDANQFR